MSLPDFHDSSIPSVKLLQGALYADDSKTWDLLLTHRSKIESYFGRVGLLLIVDELEGFAYLRQMEEEDLPQDYERMPKLIRRNRLGYDLTVFSMLLRDELRRFEEQQLDASRCLIDTHDLFQRLCEFLPDKEDDVRKRKKFDHLLVRAQELGFVRKLSTSPPTFEIRPILKARITAERLESMKEQLTSAAATLSA
ncbi:MAG: DUF4194 domain-containing protein [Verrucomicrobiota bacterium]